MTHRTLLLAPLALLLAGAPAFAGAITFSGTSGHRSASVIFQDSGTNLIVTLTNVSLSDVLVPTDVLTAVFFDIAGDPLLSRTSAIVPGGSTVHFGGTDPGGSVGGEWAYRNGLSQFGANAGISSVGLNLFGPGNRFPGNNLQGPNSPNGLEYGITSAGDNPQTGNTPVTGTQALIQNQVVFTLGNWMLGAPTPHISNVTFQYGTSFGEPTIRGVPAPSAVPEPSSWLLLGSAVAMLARRARRYRKEAPTATEPT